MSENQRQAIQLPESLDRQLQGFRAHLRRTKVMESLGIACLGILAGYLAVFVIDRMVDLPTWGRWLAWLVAFASVATIPIWVERWILRYRSHASLARLMTDKLPSLGDSLLSAIELASDPQEQKRSPALCRAALEQVAQVASTRDLTEAAPDSGHKRWWTFAAIAGALALGLGLMYPQASANSLARFAAPWSSTPRYTFAQLGELPTQWIVPHGESISLKVPLSDQSPWKPSLANLWLPGQPKIESPRQSDAYQFDLPPLIQPTKLTLRIGDATPTIEVIPTTRPELLAASANLKLPDYLQRPDTLTKDIRSGAMTIVEGTTYSINGKASRELSTVTLDSQAIQVAQENFSSDQLKESATASHEVQWVDRFGLKAKSPFPLNIVVRADEEPTIYTEGMPRAKVLLESEQIQFQVHASDDFGVKQVGFEWKTAEGAVASKKTQGERVLIAGGAIAERLDADAVFQAISLGIEPQPLELRLFVEDYLPGRNRVYSNPVLLMILSPSDHALWILQQFNRWQREALEVRDRELQLLETNKKLRALTEQELESPDVVKQIEQQAAAEQANARRLGNLTTRGEDLLRQASRNNEIGVGHLEKWAEMQKILKDISASRMPSVANLLKQASKNNQAASSQNQPMDPPKVAGVNRSEQSSGGDSKSEQDSQKDNLIKAPTVVDAESSQQPPNQNQEESEDEKKKKPSTGRLGLPQTTLAGAKPNKDDQKEQPQSPEAIEQAVEQQLALLEEFDKVSDELNKVMANLEGSTLVKRFKAASREQISVADAVGTSVPNAFGSRAKRLKSEDREALEQLSSRENLALNNVGQIIDDLEAFHERRPMVKFRDVLDDIRKEDPLAGLRKITQEVVEQQGVTIAEAEYWSDAFDRWAEDLVDPASKGQCPGGKSKGSLPPSIVLEVMQILEGEMNLRDRTRVTEQAKAAAPAEQYQTSVKELVDTQKQLRDRIVVVGEKIEELPDGSKEFAKEIELMQMVELAMNDAWSTLKRPDTGKAAVAAETEAIELLLSSKRINPKSKGGGGGANPGGGGSGDTSDAAIAMVGPGVNEKEIRQDHGVEQSTGTSSSLLPEEFRYGLDQYFERIDKRQ
ncbi:MAG: hypothetical protein ACOVOJ_13740 [Pirellula sp.]